MSAAEQSRTRTVFVPVLLLALTLVSMSGFRTFQLVQQQNELQTLLVDQEELVAEAQRIRSQLQAVARGTVNLAAEGNKNAKRVVDQLARQGVTLTSD